MNPLIIIKDPEEEIFYATIKNSFDDPCETSIIESGASYIEALEKASAKICGVLSECQKTLRHIGECIAEKSHFYLDEKHYLKAHYIEKYLGENLDQFDALIYDEESGQWHRLYR